MRMRNALLFVLPLLLASFSSLVFASDLSVSVDSSVRVGEKLGVKATLLNASVPVSNASCVLYTTSNGKDMLDLIQYGDLSAGFALERYSDEAVRASQLKTDSAGNVFYQLPVSDKYFVGSQYNVSVSCGDAGNSSQQFSVLAANSPWTFNFFLFLTENPAVPVALLLVGVLGCIFVKVLYF